MSKVKISSKRYEGLIDTETRVDIAVERIIKNKYIATEEILRILGTDEALMEVERLHEEDERREKNWYEVPVEENADV